MRLSQKLPLLRLKRWTDRLPIWVCLASEDDILANRYIHGTGTSPVERDRGVHSSTSGKFLPMCFIAIPPR